MKLTELEIAFFAFLIALNILFYARFGYEICLSVAIFIGITVFAPRNKP